MTHAPTLTIYRNGLVNLNGEATRALPSAAESLMLLPPNAMRGRWVLIAGQHGISGDIRLVGRTDRGNLRFRAPALAIALFAALPDAQLSLRLLMEPATATGWHLIAQPLHKDCATIKDSELAPSPG